MTRNVKHFIFRKLSTTSNYGYALDINQPAEFSVGVASDQADAGTSTSALIRGNLMTVWVMNHSVNSLPIRISPTGRTVSEATAKRTRWSEVAGLSVDGVADSIPTTSNTSVWSTIAGNSVYCYEVLLNPIGPQFTRIEAESFAANSGTATETCADVGGGLNVTNIVNNNWLRFDNLIPVTDAVLRFRVARSTGAPDSRIEVRLDSVTGTVIGSIAVPETGGSQIWETIEAPLAPVSGSHSIYLKFVENGSSTGTALLNLNSFSILAATAPGSFASAPDSTTQIALSWAAVAGATSYEVSRSTAIGGPYTTIATGLTGTSYADSGLTGGTRYYYKIRAVFSGVASADSTTISTVTSNPITAANVAIGSVSSESNGGGGTDFRITMPSSGLGQFYQVLGSGDLASPIWVNESAVLMGNGGLLQFDLPIALGTARRFYKVKVWRE